MTYDTTDLRRRLEEIADTPRPGPPLDVAGPAARGRRRLRARRLSAVAGSAVAVGLVATLTATGLPELGSDEPDRRSASQVSVSPVHRNPLVQRAAFGWLPQGYGVMSVIEDHQNGRHTFEMSAAPKGGLGGIRLTDFGEGPEPELGRLHLGKPARRLDADPVKGARAYWIARPGTEDGGRLRWRYGPRHWAELEVAAGPLDTAATIYRIAEALTFGTERDSAFPFRISGFPTGLTSYRSTLDTIGPGGGASLLFADERLTPDNALDLSFTAARPLSEYTSPRGPGPNTTVDGHPAVDRRIGSGKKAGHLLMVLGVNGYDVTIRASGEPLRLLEKSGGVRGLYSRLTVLGTDPSRWTTTPLG